MSFRRDLGDYGEEIVANLLRERKWRVTNVNQEHRTNLEWGDLYTVSPEGVRLFFSVKARNSIEHGSNRLIWNGRYDGRGKKRFREALDRLKKWNRPVDGVGWIAVAMNIWQTYEVYVGLLRQMIIIGTRNKTEDDWKWSIPMRPVDRDGYFPLAAGPHHFDWLKKEYESLWFYKPHLDWRISGLKPTVHESKSRALGGPSFAKIFPDIAKEPYAEWDVRRVFGKSS